MWTSTTGRALPPPPPAHNLTIFLHILSNDLGPVHWWWQCGRRSLYWSGSSYSSSASDTDSSLGLGGAASEAEHVFQPIVAAPAPHQQAR